MTSISIFLLFLLHTVELCNCQCKIKDKKKTSSGKCSRQGNIVCHRANPVISKRRKWTSQDKIIMECYLLSEPKIRRYRKRMLSLWLQKGIFWVSEQRFDQANAIRKNSWMTELKIKELEWKVTGSVSIIVEEARSVEYLLISRRRREKCFAGNGIRRAG